MSFIALAQGPAKGLVGMAEAVFARRAVPLAGTTVAPKAEATVLAVGQVKAPTTSHGILTVTGTAVSHVTLTALHGGVPTACGRTALRESIVLLSFLSR